MSEFSDSLHIKDASAADVVTRLKTAHLSGVVLPKRGAYVTVLVQRDDWDKLLGVARSIAIIYDYADDHGITVHLHEGEDEVAKLSRSFETKRLSRFDPGPWIEHGLLDDKRATLFAHNWKAVWPDHDKRHWVAEMLGLCDVDGLSGDDLGKRRDEVLKRFPGAGVVERGKVTKPVSPPAGTSNKLLDRDGEELDFDADEAEALVLCSLSKERLKLLSGEPELIADILDSRHEQTVPGLVDLGAAGLELADLLEDATRLPAVATTLLEALLARQGHPLDEAFDARILPAADVLRIATSLQAPDAAKVVERLDGASPAHLKCFQMMRQLYAEAAKRKDAMLVILE